MAKNLVIVESPAKAKTIEKYLGSDFEVLSSMGHIRDLPKSGIGIDIEHKFVPKYEISPDKKQIVSRLKSAAKQKTVWLATDEDREGEAISWHLCAALKLDPKTTKRITFHEITKPAIEAAVKEPRTVDINLVDAQQARRVLDRLVGYELSPVLWKKIKTGLSAGRVQSVAVRLIVEREREIEGFESKSDYKVTAEFKTKSGETIKAELSERVPSVKAAQNLLESLVGKDYSVSAIEQKPATKSPSAPFTTSTLQQAASTRIGFSVKQTMLLAQRLYEAGHITYMRTDSVNLSGQAVAQAKKVIESEFGADYYASRNYKSKTANAQEAHEAIRPTDLSRGSAGGDAQQQKLYQLIRARTLASQMADAKVEKTQINITPTGVDTYFVAKGEVVLFAGFLKAYGDGKKADPSLLPKISEGDKLTSDHVTATQTYLRPPARYTEASLVKKLEAEGIGRPSTYAPTISTIQSRGYVQKTENLGKTRPVIKLSLRGDTINHTEESEQYDTDRNRLMPTDTGSVVTDFLLKYFAEIMDYKFTARVEDEFDEIASGKEQWQKMIADFYTPFHKLVAASEDISRQEASQGRELGKDPKSGKPVIARLGRFGAMIQIGEAEDEEKPKFAPMPEGRKIADVTLEEALKMFELPRVVGKSDSGEEIIAQIGRFGPYLKVGDKNISLKEYDPFQVSLDEAKQLVADHQKALDERIIQHFTQEGIQVLNGRYGPYITDGKINAKIPKDTDPKKISVLQAQELLSQKVKKSTKK